MSNTHLLYGHWFGWRLLDRPERRRPGATAMTVIVLSPAESIYVKPPGAAAPGGRRVHGDSVALELRNDFFAELVVADRGEERARPGEARQLHRGDGTSPAASHHVSPASTSIARLGTWSTRTNSIHST